MSLVKIWQDSISVLAPFVESVVYSLLHRSQGDGIYDLLASKDTCTSALRLSPLDGSIRLEELDCICGD